MLAATWLLISFRSTGLDVMNGRAGMFSGPLASARLFQKSASLFCLVVNAPLVFRCIAQKNLRMAGVMGILPPRLCSLA